VSFHGVRFVNGDGGICMGKIQLLEIIAMKIFAFVKESRVRIMRSCVSVAKNATFH